MTVVRRNPVDYSDDRELAVACADGDAAATRRLLTRLLPRVRTTVSYLSPGDRDVDDYVQLALLEILRSVESYRGESRLESWVDRIAVRTAMRAIKRRRKKEQTVELDPEARPRRTVPDDSESTRLHMRYRLRKLLGYLPENQREAVVLRLVHGYSISEISDITGTPANTVRDRLRVGRKRLRARIVNDDLLRSWIDE